MENRKFSVPDVSCGHCKVRIEKALNERDDVREATVDIEAKTVSVTGSAPEHEIVELLDDIGYPVEGEV